MEYNEVLVTRLYVDRITDRHGWDVFDETGNICEGPFRSRAEARRYRHDLFAGKIILSGSARYHSPELEKKYQQWLEEWRKGSDHRLNYFQSELVTSTC
jgi:hypothetical protein